MDLPKHYDPQTVEPRLYQRWERNGYFHEEPDPARPPFIICMPPPNVTARAHLGHGSTYATMDVLTRFHRMLGDNADWLPGVDHAAIATEAVLVRELAREGLRREDLGRDRFVERAWEWSRTYGGQIDAQFRRLGFGPDWQRSRFTMDEGLSAAVRRAFVALYRDGLIYRGKRLINWDPTAQSTISDAELEYVERDGTLWQIRYPFSREDRRSGVEVATTRPETMLGDVAIAVHPKDPRYAALVGRTVVVPPRLEREIPIIADEAVDPEFGTGAVKVTPAHDPLDYEIGVRHGLAMPSVIAADATTCGAWDCSSPRYPIATRSLPASAAATSSNRYSRCSGSSRWRRWRRRPWPHTATVAYDSSPSATVESTSTGWRTSATGTSRVRFGGATSCRCGTCPTGPRSSPRVKPRLASWRAIATAATN